MSVDVGLGLFFYPRGGGAQVVRYLAAALENAGLTTAIAAGSLGDTGDRSHAPTFFRRSTQSALQRLTHMDYTAAVRAWEASHGAVDAMDATPPMHPSYEDRSGVPDKVFWKVSPTQAERSVDAWSQALSNSPFSEARVFHICHLTPLHEASHRVAPNTPLITHLHGTEMKMLVNIAADPGATEHGAWWTRFMQRQIERSAKVVTISPHDRNLALELFGLTGDMVHWIPNGVDTDHFRPVSITPDERREQLFKWFCDEPRGWSETDVTPGSIRYHRKDVNRDFFDSSGDPKPALIFVGRFLDFKRVPLLIRAHARARREHGVTMPLIVWGGSPGEWEGEHPHTVAKQFEVEGGSGVYFAGWRGHDELPTGISCADVFVAPSTDEPFGQVFLEAMACSRPVIGTLSGGPPSFVNTNREKPDGWLVPPDDEIALAKAIAESSDVNVARQRGTNALNSVRMSYSWRGVAEQFVDVYRQVGL